jgi:hypothetical protein
MIRMGFLERWLELIMKCVVFYSVKVKVNGDLTD